VPAYTAPLKALTVPDSAFADSVPLFNERANKEAKDAALPIAVATLLALFSTPSQDSGLS